jgi:hypothetical protein
MEDFFENTQEDLKTPVPSTVLFSSEELDDQKSMEQFLDSLLNEEENTLFREWILRQ